MNRYSGAPSTPKPSGRRGRDNNSKRLSRRSGPGASFQTRRPRLGSIAHAAADTRDPVRQGLFRLFEVFADSIVISPLRPFAARQRHLHRMGKNVRSRPDNRGFLDRFRRRKPPERSSPCAFLCLQCRQLSAGRYTERAASNICSGEKASVFTVFFTFSLSLAGRYQTWASPGTSRILLISLWPFRTFCPCSPFRVS